MVSLNSSQVPSTGAKDACSMKQKRISWILTEKINSSPFSFYAVWFDKYRVGELVFERAFLEVFLDVISNSELFQALFMIITGVACTWNRFCRTWWVIVTTGDDLLSDFLGRPPVFSGLNLVWWLISVTTIKVRITFFYLTASRHNLCYINSH